MVKAQVKERKIFFPVWVVHQIKSCNPVVAGRVLECKMGHGKAYFIIEMRDLSAQPQSTAS